jgi:response regulator of citrate/malate metabolism
MTIVKFNSHLQLHYNISDTGISISISISISAGISDYLSKPIDKKSLTRCLKQ